MVGQPANLDSEIMGRIGLVSIVMILRVVMIYVEDEEGQAEREGE